MYTALSNLFTILLFYGVAYNGIPYTYLPSNDVTINWLLIFDSVMIDLWYTIRPNLSTAYIQIPYVVYFLFYSM